LVDKGLTMDINEQNEYFFDEVSLIEALKKFLNKLISIPKNFKSDTSLNITEHIINNKEEVNSYKQTVENLLKTMDDFVNNLYKDSRFKDEEFYDFMDIQRITKYILTERKENIELVEGLITKFIDIFELKIKSTKNYDIQYKQLKKFLSVAKEKFYTEIYIPTNKHEKTINGIYKIMEQDFAEE
jgi:hypothetical protein